MFLRIAAAGIGGVTIVGTGLGLYLTNNKKKDHNNPSQKSADNLGEKPSQAEAQSAWQTIISSKEYKEAEKTGKIVDFVAYKDNEKVDDDANYFLMEMNEKKFVVVDNIFAIKIAINDAEIFETANSQEFVLPLFCFENENVSSIQELNFNELKKCEKNQAKKYIVVSLGDKVLEKHNIHLVKKEFSKWHTKTPEVKIEIFLLKAWAGSKYAIFKGKMLKIFHKQYQPNIT